MNDHWRAAIARIDRLAFALKCKVSKSRQVFSGAGCERRLCRLIRGHGCTRTHLANVRGCPAAACPIELDHVAVLIRGRKAVAITNEPYGLPEGYERKLDAYCRQHGLKWRQADAVGTWNPLQTKAVIIWRADSPDIEALLSKVEAGFDREKMEATMRAFREDQAKKQERLEAWRRARREGREPWRLANV